SGDFEPNFALIALRTTIRATRVSSSTPPPPERCDHSPATSASRAFVMRLSVACSIVTSSETSLAAPDAASATFCVAPWMTSRATMSGDSFDRSSDTSTPREVIAIVSGNSILTCIVRLLNPTRDPFLESQPYDGHIRAQVNPHLVHNCIKL